MNELIKITNSTINHKRVNTVDARELYEFLGVETKFNDWIERRIKEYGFIINSDFCSFLSKSTGGRPATEYHLTLNMAKELAMVERNEKGKEARQYFIKCEETAKDYYDAIGGIGLEKINLKEFEIQMIGAKYVSEMLNYSEMSKLELTHKIYKDRGLSTKALPEYLPNQKPVFAISDLLNKSGLGNIAQKINKQLVSLGILEEKSRMSTKHPDKIKKFKMLTEKGLAYGRNDSSVQNKNEVQPKYYEDKFGELLSLLGINQKEATA